MTAAALVDAFATAISGRDRDAFAAVCAIDVHYEDPLTSAPLLGLAAVGDHFERLWAAFPDVGVQAAGRSLASGSFVAAPLRIGGHHRAALGNVPATGRRLELHGVVYCELDPGGDLLWRVRSFFDLYEAGQQLGVLPAHGGVGERALLMARGFGLRGAAAAAVARDRIKPPGGSSSS